MWFFAALFLLGDVARADIEYWKVVEVSGPVEMKSPLETEWKSFSAPFYLKKGSLLRTGKDAWVDLSLNRQWDSFLRLNGDSELEFPENPPNAVRLKKGSLFVLMEGESAADTLHIFSSGISARLLLGGLAVAASETGATFKVFSESVDLVESARTLEEGWEWTAGGTRRMEFSDYTDWQQWVRKSYERKDKFFLKRSL